MSAYGRLLAASTIERGIEVTLRYFLGPYLGEVLAQAGLDRHALPDPTDLARVSEFDWPIEDDVALVVVASPGTLGDASMEPESYTARWDVRCGVVVDLGGRLESREAAQFYAAAAGAALSHQGVALVDPDGRRWTREADGETLAVLEGSSVQWLGERTRQVAKEGTRVLIAGEARLAVTVEEARSTYGGPELPPADPNDEVVPRDPINEPGGVPVVPDLDVDRL